MIRKLIMATALSALIVGASACNTVRGMGDDLKSAADTVDDNT